MSIFIITTGGTIGALPYIDPRSPPALSTFPPKDINPVQMAIKELVHPPSSWRYLELEPRDSKLIDTPYQQELLSSIEDADEKCILITHGTDRLIESATFLYDQISLRNKMILLTGAMIPLLNGSTSDGFLNLRFALNQFSEFSPGVYIVLCAHTEDGTWLPHLYRYQPGFYKKFYASDPRFNCLRTTQDT